MHILYSIIILHSCKGSTHPLPPSNIYIKNVSALTVSYTELESYRVLYNNIDEWTEATYTLMKTVLVLTLLAVTIACCYATPERNSRYPERPGKWLTHTIAMYWMIFFLYSRNGTTRIPYWLLSIPSLWRMAPWGNELGRMLLWTQGDVIWWPWPRTVQWMPMR